MPANITTRRSVPTGPDFYPTPTWATEALLAYENFEGEVWEPACGDGAMAEVLTAAGLSVYSSDLFDRGFGASGVDFLKSKGWRMDNIITNPPFSSVEDFILRALTLAKKKVAIFTKLTILETAGRYRNIFKDTPPTRVLVFSERVTLYPSGIVTAGTSMIAYCWLIWDKVGSGMRGTARPPSELHWIAPGRKPGGRSSTKEVPSDLTLEDLELR